MSMVDVTAVAARNKNLDLIKLISCVAVVILHNLYTPTYEASTVVYQLCAFAVPCFFMASGYVLLNKQSVSWGYVIGKLLGIARIVVVWHIIVCAGELLKAAVRDGWNQADYLSILKTYANYTVRSVFQRGTLWQFWYLGATGILYLLLPLLHRFLGQGGKVSQRPRRATVCWGILLAISVALQTLCLIAGRPLQQPVYQTFRLWTTLQYFLLGGLMPVLLPWLRQKLSLKCHIMLAVTATVLTLAWRLFADAKLLHGVLVEYYYDDLFTFVWIVLMFSVLMRVKLNPVFEAVATRTAPVIMGVYILHVPFRDFFRELFPITGSLERLMWAGVVCAVSFLCAFLIRKLPFGKYLIEI